MICKTVGLFLNGCGLSFLPGEAEQQTTMVLLQPDLENILKKIIPIQEIIKSNYLNIKYVDFLIYRKQLCIDK